MNAYAKLAIAAVAVVVVAFVGINLLPEQGGIGGPWPKPVADADTHAVAHPELRRQFRSRNDLTRSTTRAALAHRGSSSRCLPPAGPQSIL